MIDLEQITKLQTTIHQRRIKTSIRNDYKRLFRRTVMIVIIGLLIFTQMFYIGQAKDNGMYPSIEAGDLVIGYRLQSDYQKDDVVIYEIDGERHIGRIIAQQTDVVRIDDESGTVLVNGTDQSGEIVFSTYTKEGIEYPYTVPNNSVFILGDYRTHSEDSRDYGAISLDQVKAKVITIMRRREI